ncbi:hypothetical protein EBQ74_00615 [bacterium]|nr:hypothetical protein [bacterium]
MFPWAITSFSLLSGISFLFYGVLCLTSKKMVKEFERYRLSNYRRMVGFLELGGGLGQLIGLYHPPLAMLSSGGLALLMLCGIWARWRIRDAWYLCLPALILFGINAALFLISIQ